MIGAFRGLLLGSVLMWYSGTVWKTMDNYYNREFKKYLEKEKEARRIPFDEEICTASPAAQVPSCGHGGKGAVLKPPFPAEISSPASLPAGTPSSLTSTNDASGMRNDVEKPEDILSCSDNEDYRLERQLEEDDTCPTEPYVLQTPKQTDEL